MYVRMYVYRSYECVFSERMNFLHIFVRTLFKTFCVGLYSAVHCNKKSAFFNRFLILTLPFLAVSFSKRLF